MYLKALKGQGVPSHCSSAAGSHLLLSQTSKGERIWVGNLFVFVLLFFFFPLIEANISKASAAWPQVLGAEGAAYLLTGAQGALPGAAGAAELGSPLAAGPSQACSARAGGSSVTLLLLKWPSRCLRLPSAFLQNSESWGVGGRISARSKNP